MKSNRACSIHFQFFWPEIYYTFLADLFGKTVNPNDTRDVFDFGTSHFYNVLLGLGGFLMMISASSTDKNCCYLTSCFDWFLSILAYRHNGHISKEPTGFALFWSSRTVCIFFVEKTATAIFSLVCFHYHYCANVNRNSKKIKKKCLAF